MKTWPCLPARLLTLALPISVALLGKGMLTAADPTPVFQAGFAERDITPEIGMERPGGYGKAYHRAFHDACKVRAAVFDNGRAVVALVGTDTLMIPRELVLSARAEIERRYGIPGGHVLVGASHSHSSGPVGMVQPGQFDGADRRVQELAYKLSSAAHPEFLDLVRRQLVAAVGLAYSGRQPARLGFGSGVEDQVAFNRRLRMSNGLTFTHPGKGNPEMFDYAGPVDPEVGVIGAWDEEGVLLGCIVNFACHATTSPPGISANWIHYLEQTIQGALHAEVPVVFLAGANGDITQVDNLSPYQNPDGDTWARRVGGRVGAEAVKVLLSMTAGTDIVLAAKQKVWSIPRRRPDPEHVKQAWEKIEQGPSKAGATAWAFAKETLMLQALIEMESGVEVEVQAIQVGPAVFVSNPAEFFCQLGLDIKAGSPFPFTWPVELANGCVGYVPTAEAFGPHGGGYETRLTSYSNLPTNAGTRMVQEGLNLVGTLQPGPVFEPPRAPTFKAPWSYGAVPPQVK